MQHVKWRMDHGGFPVNPGKVIFSAGTNNIYTGSSKEAEMIANTILQSVENLLASYPSIELAILGICPRQNATKCRAAELINNKLRYMLPASVKFIPPPNELFDINGLPNMTFFKLDRIHLNLHGYKLIFKDVMSQMSLFDEASPAKVPPGNPIAYGIGELEYLGGGWDGETATQADQDPKGYRVLLDSSGPLRPTPVIAVEEFPPLPIPLPPPPPPPTHPRLDFYAKRHRNSTAVHRPHAPAPRQAPPLSLASPELRPSPAVQSLILFPVVLV